MINQLSAVASALAIGQGSTAYNINVGPLPPLPEPFSPQSRLGLLPIKNTGFTGRVAQLAEIARSLSQVQQGVVIQSVVGLGGVGKTQLVTEYVHQSIASNEYAFIAWLDGAHPERAYRSLGECLGLVFHPNDVDVQDIIAKVEQRLSAHYPSLLLVWDDAKDEKQMLPYLDSAARLNAHCLITSRAQYWTEDTSLTMIRLDVFSKAEALSFLSQRFATSAGLYDEVAAKNLAHTVGYLPLALAQAAAYILMRRKTYLRTYALNDYLSAYTETQINTKKEIYDTVLSRQDNYINKTVWTTWYLSIEALKTENPQAVNLIEQCAYLDEHEIQDKLLSLLNNSPEDAIRRSIDALLAYSLVERLMDNHLPAIKIHQILQAVIRLHLHEEPLSSAIPLSLSELDDITQEEHPVSEALMMRRYLTDKTSQWLWDQRREVLNYPPRNPPPSSEELEAARAQKENPATALRRLVIPESHNTREHQMIALLLKQLQKSFQYDVRHMEQLREAQVLFATHIKAVCNHAFTAEVGEPDAANVLSRLGSLAHYLKDAKEMRESFHNILPYYERFFSNHPLLGKVLNNLATAYSHLGNPQEQNRLLQQALVIIERDYGPEHVEVAGILGNLANAYGALGDHQEQQRLLQHALVIEERYYGAEHVVVASTLNNLANAYGDLGNHQEKKRLLQRALAIKERYYGPEHVEVASILNNLANAYSDLGDPQEQKRLLQRALGIQERYYGPEHVEVASTLNNLANAYGDLGDPQEQKRLLQCALGIQEGYYGPEHVEVASTLNNLANAYGDLGDPQEQKRLLQQALRIQERYYGPEHVEVARILNNLANAYSALGEFPSAQNSYQRALRIQQHFLRETHPEVGKIFHNLAVLHFQQQEFSLSLAYLKQAHAIFLHHSNCGPTHPYTLKTLELLKDLLKEWGPQRYEAPEHQYLHSQQIYNHVFPDKDYPIGASAELTQKAKERLTLCREKAAKSTPHTPTILVNPQESIMPMPYDYALMSKAIYSDDLSIEGSHLPILNVQQLLQEKGWRLLTFIASVSDYRGGVWVHPASKEMVIAHRGSQNATSWVTDVESIVQHKPGAFVNDALALLRHPTVLQYRKDGFRLSTTGHSLGGFLAQVCVYWSQRQDFKDTHYPEMSAMVFDSPGAGDFLDTLQSNLKREQSRVNLNHLNIHNFCVMPTIVSTFGTSVATTWHLSIDATIEHAFFNAHKMEYILQGFNPTTGQPRRFQQMLDWPKADYSAYESISGIISTSLHTVAAAPFACLNNLYKKMKFLRTRDVTATYYDQLAMQEGQVQYYLRTMAGKTQPPILEEVTTGLVLAIKAHYSAYDEQNSKKRIDIHHFTPEVQLFLQSFKLAKCLIKDNSWQKALEERYGEVGCNVLQSFVIEEQEDKVELVLSSADDSSIFDFQAKLSALLQKGGCLSFMDFLANTIESMKTYLEDVKEGSKLAKELEEKVRILEEAQAMLETKKASCESNDTLDMYVVAGAAVNQPGATARNTNENIRIEDIVAMIKAAPHHNSSPGTSRVTVIAGAVSTATGGIAENRNVFYRPSPQTTPATDSKEETHHPK
jgi:tetratricopeptide (TPR) repeat protein